MELLKWELRKIWRPGNLAAILLLGAVAGRVWGQLRIPSGDD